VVAMVVAAGVCNCKCTSITILLKKNSNLKCRERQWGEKRCTVVCVSVWCRCRVVAGYCVVL
jgi:hypothetical protein